MKKLFYRYLRTCYWFIFSQFSHCCHLKKSVKYKLPLLNRFTKRNIELSWKIHKIKYFTYFIARSRSKHFCSHIDSSWNGYMHSYYYSYAIQYKAHLPSQILFISHWKDFLFKINVAVLCPLNNGFFAEPVPHRFSRLEPLNPDLLRTIFL